MNNKYSKLSMKDKITIMQDKYEKMDDSDYKKRQLKIKIDELKRKYNPKVFWSKGTYYRKELEEQNKEEIA